MMESHNAMRRLSDASMQRLLSRASQYAMLLPAVLLLACSCAFAKDSADNAITHFYVSKIATGSHDGSSWQNAWTDFDQIDWGKVQAAVDANPDGQPIAGVDGNVNTIVEIDGGTNSMQYQSQLHPRVNVSSKAHAHPLVCRSQDVGHCGQVILSGAPGDSSKARCGIELSDQNGIYLDGGPWIDGQHPGIRITQWSGDGVSISNDNDAWLSHLEVDHNATSGGGAGINLAGTGTFMDDIWAHENGVTGGYKNIVLLDQPVGRSSIMRPVSAILNTN